MNRAEERIINIIRILFYALVLAVPLFYLRQSVYPYVFPKTGLFLFLSELIFGLYLALALNNPALRPRRTNWLTALGVFLGALALTSLAGEDPARSFWSVQERQIGVYALLHFAALALAASSLYKHLPWRKIWSVSLMASATVGIVAITQLRINNLLLVEDAGNRPGGTFGNPTFLAGYVLFHVFLGIYLWLSSLSEEKARNKSWLYFLAWAVSASAIFITQTRGDILGLAVGLLLLFVLWCSRAPGLPLKLFANSRFYLGLIIFAVLFAGLFFATYDSPAWQKVPGLARFQGAFSAYAPLAPRALALQASWQGIRERPVLGWGWENFNLVFNKYYNPSALRVSFQETRFDKPHNFIAEYAVSGGMLLLLAFLTMAWFFLKQAWQGGDRLWAQIITACFAAYFVRNLFVFDTIGPLLMLYLVMAATDGMYREKTQAQSEEVRRSGAGNGARLRSFALAGTAAALFLSLGVNLPNALAANRQYWGFKYILSGKTEQAIPEFRAATDHWTPNWPDFAKDYAKSVADAHFYGRGPLSEAEVRQAAAELERAAAAHPKNAYFWNALLDVYNKLSDIDRAYLDKSEEAAQTALRLSPRRQETYFGWAKAVSLMGDNVRAETIAKEALDFDPEVAESNFYYGLLAYVNGKTEEGYGALRKAIELGRPWKNHMEPRVVANFFADSGHLEEAVRLYQKSLDLKDNFETRAKLGMAYYLSGDRVRARQNLAEAARQADLSQTSVWPDLLPIFRELQISTSGK